MGMRKLYVIAAREYSAAVKTKAFIISLILMPLLMGGSVLMQELVKNVRDLDEKRFAVVDRTPGKVVLQVLRLEIDKYNDNLVDPETGKQVRARFALVEVEPGEEKQQHYALSERVRQGDLVGFLDVGAQVLSNIPDLPDPNKEKQSEPDP